METEVIFEVKESDFKSRVVDASHNIPVLVDFWAPWCGPCKTLGPTLEKLAKEYKGAFILAKINTDEYPQLAQIFQVQGIPSVKLIKNGQIENEFTGAMAEAQIRKFLEPHIQAPKQSELEKIKDLIASGKLPKAIQRLREYCKNNPEEHEAIIILAEILFIENSEKNQKEATGLLNSIKKDSSLYQKAQSILAKEKAKSKAGDSKNNNKIQSQMEKEPQNWKLRFDLAEIQMGQEDYRDAMENLLLVLEKSDDELKKEAHKSILTIFELMGQSHPEVMKYRRALANILF